jgi:hypothetical protein
MTGYSLKAEMGCYEHTGNPVQFLLGIKLHPGRPFFEYVLTYLCASAGFTPVYDAAGQPGFMENTVGVFYDSNGNKVQMDLREAVLLARDGTTLPQVRAEQRLCCMLINTAYESLNENDKRKLAHSPVGQYFRHVRNAASHDNRWHFVVNGRVQEPSKPAEWGSFKIDHALKGKDNPLHGAECVYGTHHPADLLYLLRDVEALLI